VVDDRPVEYKAETPVRGSHRLLAIGGIEYRQPAHAYRSPVQRFRAGVIGAPMRHGLAHPFHGSQPIHRGTLWIYNSSDSTHLRKLRPVTSHWKKQSVSSH
jgi:hypothetical protein